MFFERPAYLQRAFDGFFLTVVEDKRHAIAGGYFEQAPRCFRALKLIRTTSDLIECVEQRALLVDH